MPVSVTVTTSSVPSRLARMATLPPSGVNLTAFVTRLRTTCLNLQLVGVDGVDVVGNLHRDGDRVQGRPLPHHREGVLQGAADAESAWLEHHVAGFDLRKVQDVVEQLEQVLARVPDVAQIFVLALVELAEHAIEQHLGEPDHRVQRGPQFVRHAGQELRLVAAGDFELAGLGLQLAEQACVDDGQRGLAGEGFEQLDQFGREGARPPAPDHQHPHHVVAAQHGNREHRAPAVPEQDLQMWVALGVRKVGNLQRAVAERGSTHQGRVPVNGDRPQPCQQVAPNADGMDVE